MWYFIFITTQNIHEHLGIPLIEDTDELFAISDPVTEPAIRVRDYELARSAFRAVATILYDTGHISSDIVVSFMKEAEQRIAISEQTEERKESI